MHSYMCVHLLTHFISTPWSHVFKTQSDVTADDIAFDIGWRWKESLITACGERNIYDLTNIESLFNYLAYTKGISNILLILFAKEK